MVHLVVGRDRGHAERAVEHAVTLRAAVATAPGFLPDEAAGAGHLAPAVARALPLSELLLARAWPAGGA